MNKYTYYIVIQGNYGRGWDDIDFYECDSSEWIKNKEARQTFKDNLKAYRENEPYPHRVIFRKELNEIR